MIENPGPLAELIENPAGTFRSGMYNMEELLQPKIMYHAGTAENPLGGQYFSEFPPSSESVARIEYAIKSQWINPVTGELTGSSPIDTVFGLKFPKGTILYKGPVGYQSGIYIGASEQIFISRPWEIPDVEVISKLSLP
jgi:hypothetical protein